MEETKPKAEEKPTKKEKPKKATITVDLHQEFAKHYFRRKRMKPGKKYKFEESYKALEEQVKACEGLKAHRDRTIAIRGGKVFKLTENYPNPPEIKTLIEGMHDNKVADKIIKDLFKL